MVVVILSACGICLPKNLSLIALGRSRSHDQTPTRRGSLPTRRPRFVRGRRAFPLQSFLRSRHHQLLRSLAGAPPPRALDCPSPRRRCSRTLRRHRRPFAHPPAHRAPGAQARTGARARFRRALLHCHALLASVLQGGGRGHAFRRYRPAGSLATLSPIFLRHHAQQPQRMAPHFFHARIVARERGLARAPRDRHRRISPASAIYRGARTQHRNRTGAPPPPPPPPPRPPPPPPPAAPD